MTTIYSDCGAALGAGYAQARYQHQGEGFYSPVTQRWFPAWALTLNVDPGDSWEEIKRAYHALAAINHPDHGGSHEAMTAIDKAYEQAYRQTFGRR